METDKTKLDNDKILKLINNKDQMKHLTIWNTQPKWKYMHLKNFRLKSVNLVQRSIPNQLQRKTLERYLALAQWRA